jgi:uroporphyrinogen-III synthase
MAFDGLRVLALESRRAVEMAELIRRQGGEPFVAPSMREAPLENNAEAFAFAEHLFQGHFDMMILLTGVGTRALNTVLASRYGPEKFPEALRRMTVVARGPKPLAVLREMQIPVTVTVPEPNTWRELLAATEGRPEKCIAIQEYGKSNVELLEALRARGAHVTPVRVYQWELPRELGLLRDAVRRLAEGQIDVALFTTSQQVPHLLRIAGEELVEAEALAALRRVCIASIGPTTSEALEEFGLHPDLEPSHPKMGFLVKETAERAAEILALKRGAGAKE